MKVIRNFHVVITTAVGEQQAFEMQATTMRNLIDAINAKYPDCEIDCIEPLDLG